MLRFGKRLNGINDRQTAKRALIEAIDKACEAASVAGVRLRDIADCLSDAERFWRSRWATLSPIN